VARQLTWIMRASIALLLIGHGGLGIWVQKKEWLDFFAYLGFDNAAVRSMHLSQWVGWCELIIGILVLISPLRWRASRGFLVFILIWKLTAEPLRPLVGQPIYQFIERGGDYALPLALWCLAGFLKRPHDRFRLILGARQSDGPNLRGSTIGALIVGAWVGVYH
jgi:uncharacterized membrane protein